MKTIFKTIKNVFKFIADIFLNNKMAENEAKLYFGEDYDKNKS
jgi:hypothetical protein